MLSVYRTLSLRYLLRRWVRALLIVASIALGVATLVATRALNETMNRAGLAAVNPMPGVADLVVSYGDIGVSADLARTLAQVPGVQEAWPRIIDHVQLPDLDNRTALVLGIDPGEDKKNKGLNIKITYDQKILDLAAAFARLPKFMTEWLEEKVGPTPVVVGKELEQAIVEYNKAKPRSPLPAFTPDTVAKILDAIFPVQKGNARTRLLRVGTVEAEGAAAMLSGNVLIMHLADAAQVLGMKKGQVNRIDLILKPGVNKDKVRSDVEKVVAGQGVVRTPREHDEAAGNAMAGMQTGFSLCGLAALVVGMFLVYNALAVCVAERRHEVGVLLSLGASRSQIRWLFGGEAAVLGLAGSILGIPLGIGLAYLGLQPVQEILRDIFMNIEADQVEVSGWLIFLAMAAGLLTSVLAALVPAMAASREIPAEAVRRGSKAPALNNLARQIAGSLGLMGLGAGFIVLRRPLGDVVGQRVGSYGGMVLVLLGALLAAPLVTALFARLIQPFAQRFWPITWRLAADNLVRAPGRTGLVIAALAAGVALVTQTYGTIVSNRTSLSEWIQEAIAADLIVTSGSPVGAGGGQTRLMDAGLADQIRALPEVEEVLPMRMVKIDFGGTRVLLFALDAAGSYRMEQKRHAEPNNLPLYKALSETSRTAIVSNNFAALHGIDKGDTISLMSPRGEVRLRVAGKMEDYSWNHGTIFVNRSEYKEFWGNDKPDTDVFDVYVRPGADLRHVQETLLKKLGAQNGLVVQTRKEVQDRVEDMIERLYGIALSQQFVVMFVAALGVVTALLISVLQRRREMGLLRAIGASRAQVVRSVLAEACLMGIIGTILGFVVGIPIEWYILKVLILEESGYLFSVYIPWRESLIIVAAGLLTPIMAGIGPALHSVRKRIPEAIAYE